MVRFRTGSFVFPFIVLIGLALITTKCSKNETSSNIPDRPVNLVINVNTPANFNLQSIGGFEYYAGGSRGVLIYRNDIDDFKAYDRHSTFQPENGCAVEVDSTFVALEDPCSTSRYSIFDGTVINGPAVVPLRQYQTSFDGVFLRVFN